jgi:hypothetical protein
MVMVFLFFAAFIALMAYASARQKKTRAQKIEQQAINKTVAQNLNMNVNSTVQGQNDIVAKDDYSGTTGDIPWTLQSREIQYNNSNHNYGSSWKRTTRWNTAAARMENGKFFMIMSTPGFDNSKNKVKKGFFSGVVNKLAEFALDTYVKGYFGPQYTSLVNIDGATKIDIPELKEFFILTNDDPLSKKFLTDITVKYMVNWMHNKPHFTHDRDVNLWGALFSADGIIVSCQADMENADEAKVFSDFGASLATLMKEASLQVS